MSKRIILWLLVFSGLLTIIGLAVFLPAVFSAAQSCSQTQLQAGTCRPAVSAGEGVGFAVGILLFIVAGLLATIAWIGALIRAARMQTWVWFVIILLLHGVGTLIYAIAGPASQPALATSPLPGYPPVGPPPYPQQ